MMYVQDHSAKLGNLRHNGVPVAITASILGHSPEVNSKHYTYDTSNLAEKKKSSRIEMLK